MNQVIDAEAILKATGLQKHHFADLIRVAQLIYDPTTSTLGRTPHVDWVSFGIAPEVVENLRLLGKEYQYSNPHINIEIVWNQLCVQTRKWLMENKNQLTYLEESIPAFDED